ncbi:carbon storage regulator CsrA [Brevibacillus ruminantium]|uniref:Translational regulator CsrA n=1 Tax=Brevibacillus ruminantium TaxID=2950604 RepID=A0ABY4WH27_9BACL|nr:carbon storage regulator CsrA [Brevibacillus ruminantium]USG65327.1 carbon storage regulator CsrA [Brevibacillus ruminantium]
MLVLSRKKNESIMIGDSIEIKVIAVEGDTVRLGIEAPRNVEVYRKEIYEAIQEENKIAIQHQTDWAEMKEVLKKARKSSDDQ